MFDYMEDVWKAVLFHDYFMCDACLHLFLHNELRVLCRYTIARFVCVLWFFDYILAVVVEGVVKLWGKVWLCHVCIVYVTYNNVR